MSDAPSSKSDDKSDGGKSAEPTTWLNMPERGALLGIRFVFWLATAFGRWPARLFLKLLAFWYRVFDRKAARASRDWLTRVHGKPPGWWDVYRHILRFANVTLDRMFLLRGKVKGFTFTRTGDENLQHLRDSKQGAILLGAHLGSYEAMRLGGDEDEVQINIVGHFENAKMINVLFEKLNPERAARVIHVGQSPMNLMVKIQNRLEAGELVAMLADRVGLRERAMTVDFFGAPARFSAGPFLLAATLKVPIFLTFGLYTEPNRYDLFCQPFADRLVLPRKRRQEALQEYVQEYARRLEEFCLKAPDNWFNFYDFWAIPDESTDSGDDASGSKK